ncbi:unnamed protein product [Orchesella dallaii]|uniref:G-protein coupled receptor Mth2 n=1 Tax=Orchesella dallaii TaxID=48710 RepID=A0ABP1R7N6_9HEXA
MLIFLMSLCWVFVNSSIISIQKKDMRRNNLEKVKSLAEVKNYCVHSGKESFDGEKSVGFKIECSKVAGPYIQINEVGIDGYLKLDSGHFIAPTEYCVVDGLNFVKLCPSHSDPLWRKCCEENQIFDSTSLKCRQSRTKYRPKVQELMQSFHTVWNKTDIEDFTNSCPQGLVPKIYSTDPCLSDSSGSFQLAPNGTPMYQQSTGVFLRKNQLRPVEHEFYCVDGLMDFSSSCDVIHTDGTTTSVFDGDIKCHKEMETVLLVCLEDQETFVNEGDDQEKGVPKAYFLAAIWFSTCPLLVSAAIANSCVIQKNVHGWILTSYLISMFLVNINSVVLILDIGPVSEGCGVLDFTMKFIYMSTLCWMTSMNFGLWRTFSSSVPQVVTPQRFILSAMFSLGFPTIAVSVSYYVGSLPDHQERNSKAFTCQKETCSLYSYKTLPYYHGPIIFLVFCNAAAFIKTSVTIAKLRRQAEAVLHKQTKDHLESFTLFAKLFLLTGSIWVIRVILLVLQIQGLYLTWYGVLLEAVFSIPEVVFPMIIFHHQEFIKWAWRKSPMISRILIKCNPFCRKDIFKEANSVGLQSGNQVSIQRHNTVMSQTHMNANMVTATMTI